MGDKRIFLTFCEYLCGLLASGLPIGESLEILAKPVATNTARVNRERSSALGATPATRSARAKPVAARSKHAYSAGCGKKLQRLSERILSFMKRGYSFSSAVSVNGIIRVDEKLCSLIAAADKAGNLCGMLKFITDTEAEKSSFSSKLAGAILYPLGITLLAGGGSLFLVKNCAALGFKAVPDGVFSGLVTAIAFIGLFISAFLWAAFRAGKENPHLIFFSSLSFFLSCGFDLKNALSLVSIAGGLKNASLCASIIQKLSCGVPFSKSLVEIGGFSSEAVALIALAEKSGDLASACKTIASRISTAEKQEKQRFLRYGEPVLLSAVGVYVLLLAQNVILPFITDFEYML